MSEIRQNMWLSFLSDPNETTFGPIYDQAKGLVWMLCLQILNDPEDAADAFQAAWCRFWADVKAWRGSAARAGEACESTLRRHLYRLVVREAQNLRGRRSRRAKREMVMEPLNSTPCGDPSAESLVARAQLRTQIEALMRLLPEDNQTPLRLYYFQGLSQAEIARALGLNQGSVSRRITKGLIQLKRLMLKAGLGGAIQELTALGFASPLVAPPAGFSAGVIYAQIQSALAAGAASLTAGGCGAVAGKLSIGAIIVKVKMALLTGVVILGLGALVVGKQLMTPGAAAKDAVRRSELITKTQPAVVLTGSVAGIRENSRSSMPPVADSPHDAMTTNSRAQTQPANAGIAGRVIDTETKRAITGAEVKVAGKLTGRTDSRGFYQIHGVAPGKSKAVATAWGHAISSASLIFPSNGRIVQNFELDPAADIYLQVNDEQGAPVVAADIDVVPVPGARTRRAGKTDFRGQLVMPAMSRLHTPVLRIMKDGYEVKIASGDAIDFNPEKTRGTITIILKSKLNMAVQGQVVDTQGNPVPLVTVLWGPKLQLPPLPDPALVNKALTDEHGRYLLRFQSDTPECQIGVYGEGWAPAINKEVIAGPADRPAEVNFKIERSHWMEGVVVNEAAEPVAGVQINVDLGGEHSNIPFPHALVYTHTNEQGGFRFENISGPTVDLVLCRLGNLFLQHEYNQPVDRSVRLTLKSPGVIVGRVEDKETGKPIPLFTIKINHGIGLTKDKRNRGAYVGSEFRNQGKLFNSPQGGFSLNNLERDCMYTFNVTAEGYLPAQLKDIPTGLEKNVTRQVIRLGKGHEIRGVVLDAATKRPLRGAKVGFGIADSYSLNWDVREPWSKKLPNGTEILTAADGCFSFKEDEPGTLFIQAEGYRRLAIPPQKRTQYLVDPKMFWIPLARAVESIRGTYYENGHPAPASYLALIPLSGLTGLGGAPVRETLSLKLPGVDGIFSRDGLQPGTYLLEVRSKSPLAYRTGGTRIDLKFELKEGEQKIVNFGKDLGPFIFKGRLLDAQGAPLNKVFLVLQPDFPSPYEFSSFVAAAYQGHFWIPCLRPGRYRMAYSKIEDPFQRRIPLPPIEIIGNIERDIIVPAGRS